MAGDSFVFKQFIVKQNKCAMKVGTDSVMLGAWANLPYMGNALDIGAGTGIIAIMVAQRSNTEVDAIEIERDAYSQAVENCGNCKWEERIKVHHSSFQNYVSGCVRKYDVIISNPPYFSNSLPASSEQRTKARHTNDLSFEELVDGIVLLMHKHGSFATILPLKEAEDLVEIAKARGLNLSRLTRIKTTPPKPEKRVMMEFTFSRDSFSENTIVIENDDRSFTPEYKELTREFYLGF